MVEFATTQFEENTKKIEELIKKREENIALSVKLKGVIEAANEKQEGWEDKVEKISDKFGDDIIDSLNIVGDSKTRKSQSYTDAMKFLKARVNNLEANLHIEIDMERLEDSSKALSYIGIEIADALKLIPAPEEQIEAVAVQNAIDEKSKNTELAIEKEEFEDNDLEELVNETLEEAKETQTIQTIQENQDATFEEEQQQYEQAVTFEAKPSLWQRFKNSKIVRAATYVFRIKVKIELPGNALPEGRGNNQ